MKLNFALSVLMASLVVGCGSSDPEESGPAIEEDELLPLSPPENGFQLRTVGRTIHPGEDVEFCEVLEVPGNSDDIYYVEGFDVMMTEFSHHLLVNTVAPGSESESELVVGQNVACTGAHSIASFADVRSFAGSQERSKSYTYPEGIGKIVTGGTKIIFDYHYLNTSTDPIPAAHALNVRLTTEDRVRKVAQTMAFVNLGIDTPARSQASFVGECALGQSAMLGSITRHTHRWGTDFSVWHAGGDKDGEHIWTSTDWDGENDYVFDTPMRVGEGSGFRFQCDFNNTTDAPLRFGSKATDEMCILFGQWWVENEGDEVQPQICIMVTPDEDGIARGFRPDPSMLPGN